MNQILNWKDIKEFVDTNKCKHLLKSIELGDLLYIWLNYNNEKFDTKLYKSDIEAYDNYITNYKPFEEYNSQNLTKIIQCENYQQWKYFIETKKINIHYQEFSDKYCLTAFDGIYFRYDYKLLFTDTESKLDFETNYKGSPHTNNSQEKHDPLKYSAGKQYSPMGKAIDCESEINIISFQFDHDIKLNGVVCYVDASKGDYIECKVFHPGLNQYISTFGETLYLHPNVYKYEHSSNNNIVKTIPAGLRIDFIYTKVSTEKTPYLVIHLKKWESS